MPLPAMTVSTIELTASLEDRRIAGLAAAAIGLTLVEAAIPLPIPGIKPGLANIVTLVVLYRYGWRTAAWVAGLRIVAGALALGQFLTPAFVLSLAGGAISLMVLAAAIQLPPRWFGPVALSLLAAFAHIGAQLFVVDVWLLPGASIFGLLPIFLAAAWITGLGNGVATAYLLKSKPQSAESH
jgi:heptaprenyl diphosphate synthase